jgi:hypothetical protein
LQYILETTSLSDENAICDYRRKNMQFLRKEEEELSMSYNY